MSSTLPPFKWPKTVAEIQLASEDVIREATANLDGVAATPDAEVTFENVVAPLVCPPNYKTNPKVCQSKFLQHCSTDPVLREAAAEAGKKFAAFKNSARSREDVYAKVCAFKAKATGLTDYQQHFLQAVVGDFERGGLGLSAADKANLKTFKEQDAAVCSEYGANLGNDSTKLYFTTEELAGCSEDFVTSRTGADGRVAITLKYPDIIPISRNCSVAETRKAVTMARGTAYGNNLDLVAKGIGLRKQVAQLLGFKSWAHYITAGRMAGSLEAVNDFSDDIYKLALDGAKEDLERLKALKVAALQKEDPSVDAASVEVESWDQGFYGQQLLKQDYGVDSELVRQYFPLDHVIRVTLETYQDLLGLKFTEITEFEAWHDEVRLFEVHDKATVAAMGHFYLDLHPREGKYGHAAIFHLLKQNGDQKGVDCMLCNLPAPSADGTQPLLLHSNVVTFFHEFGHIMHGLCAEGDGNSTSIAKCPRDFVEAPSQMLENWCWQPKVLATLSRHHKTGQPLPTELLDKLIAAKNVNSGFSIMRQVYLGKLDLAIHSEQPPANANELQALVDDMCPKISLVRNPPNCNMLRSFGHLMNQYSAAYYGYLWAEVLSADMFAERFEADCYDKEAGMAYRKLVLAPGGIGNINDHLAKFLGRKPNREAFLKSRGILKDSEPQQKKQKV